MQSELRRDPVTGDWIAIAPQRAKKPDQLIKKEKRKRAPLRGCPFENPQKNGNGTANLRFNRTQNGKEDWGVQVFKNKFPAFTHRNICPAIGANGPYAVIDGVGHHEVVLTKDHHANFPKLQSTDANLVLRAFQERYWKLAEDPCTAYISLFHNWGPKAGASIYHPHYQLISLPMVPPNVWHSIKGSAKYFRKHQKCVHCVMIQWEQKEKSRIVYEDKEVIAYTPFVSREPFEMRVTLKAHRPYFEDSPMRELSKVAEALQTVLSKMEKKLGDPDYNFFIHTAPVHDKKKFNSYHWHIEVQPKISISAGFELGTGIEITVVDPDEAAKVLRK